LSFGILDVCFTYHYNVKCMSYTQSTISSKNQVVVPAKVRRALGLGSGDALLWKVVLTPAGPKAVAETKPKDWADHTKGLGKDVWQTIDTENYIQELRNEWSENK